MKTKITTLLTAIIIVLTITNCKKEGPVGPEGPQGPAGPAAQTDTYTVTFYQSGTSYRTDISDGNITQAIVDNGAVLTYMSNGSGGWSALPLTYFPTTAYSRTFEAIHYLNAVTIWNYDSDGVLPANPGTKTFKIVAISGNRIGNWPLNVDKSDYNQVKKYLQLRD